jgi:copper(I)-binding protein
MYPRIVIALLLLLTVSLTACGAGPAGPQIRVEDAWTRPVPAVGGNGAVFFRLVNGGTEADTLVGGECPDVGTVEVHKTSMVDGVMKMEHIPGIQVPPRGEVLLKPGDYHVMLIDVKRTMTPGDSLPITLYFEKSGHMELEVEVREMSK